MLDKPLTPIETVTDVLHGRTIKDDYRWLEDGDDPRVKEWVDAQNAYTESVIQESAPLDVFARDLGKQLDVETYSELIPVNGRYFWQERKQGEDQPSVYVKHGREGVPRKLITSPESTVSIDYWTVSSKATYVAYGLSRGGDEMATLYIMDVATGENVFESIPYARYADVSWLSNESGFYYTRHPAPGTVPPGDEHFFERAYFHQLGSNPDQDPLVFGENRPKDDMLHLILSTDDQYLIIRAAQNWNRNDIYLYDCQTQHTRALVEGLDHHFTCSTSGDWIFIDTNYKADNYHMYAAPLSNIPESLDDWQEIIPESAAILQTFRLTKSKIIVEYMKDACSEVKLFEFDGTLVGELPLPPYSDFAGIGWYRREEEFFFGVTTFLTPKVSYASQGGVECNVYRQMDGDLNPADYTVAQEWVVSKDGTKVPMFIIHKADLVQDGTNPTVLYGYGCHGNAQTPSYLRTWTPWLERGGVYALANIRGGGEYGEKWHRDGSTDKKQNTFDDFIAAAEHLIAQKYTSAEHLGIIGGSNGGLMVGAVMTQRPDLFKAVVCNVPVLDMARFHKFLIAHRWIAEFGDPNNPKDFGWLMEWSPYHNVKEGVAYPNVLFTTANKDTRVDPLHARKMTALMQRVNKEGVILLRTEMDAGHGSGKPLNKRVAGAATTQAFFAWQLGLTV